MVSRAMMKMTMTMTMTMTNDDDDDDKVVYGTVVDWTAEREGHLRFER